MNAPDYGAEVRAARKHKGMTQRELADAADVSLRSIQGLENGTTKKPHADNLRAIYRALELDDEGEAIAEVTRNSWRPTTQVALDVLGAYLDSLPEDEAVAIIADLTRQIFAARAK